MYVFSFLNYILSLFRKGECCIDYTIEGDQCIGIVFKTIYITVINFFIDNFSIKYFIFKVCPNGTHGKHCSKLCRDGLYGEKCKKKCPSGCNKTCDKVSGSCSGHGLGNNTPFAIPDLYCNALSY